MSGICWEELSELMALSEGASLLSSVPAAEHKADLCGRTKVEEKPF